MGKQLIADAIDAYREACRVYQILSVSAPTKDDLKRVESTARAIASWARRERLK